MIGKNGVERLYEIKGYHYFKINGIFLNVVHVVVDDGEFLHEGNIEEILINGIDDEILIREQGGILDEEYEENERLNESLMKYC